MTETTTRPDVDQSTPEPAGRIAGVRLRVVLLILVMQAALLWWTADSELARGIHLLCYSLMMPTVLYLFFTRLLRRWLPFKDHELLLVYIVLTATMPIVGYGGMRFVAEGMGYIPFFSTSQPTLARYLPSAAGFPALHDPDAIGGLYRGGPGIPWRAWALPIAYWSTYLALLAVIWICLAAILRRIWVSQERLTFPIAVLPLQITSPREDMFRRPIFWLGFALPAIGQSLLALNMWFPSIPAMQLKAYDVRPILFPSPPWNAIPNLPLGFYPMAIGLAYFVPGDVSFSCWFLSLAMRFVYVIGAAFGVESAGTGAARFPYREEQACGAWLALAGLVIWGARHHWRTVAKLVPPEERRMVARMVGLALACTCACAGMMAAVGIQPLAAAGVILVYVAYVMSGARVRAEAGCQWTFAPLVWTPHRVMNSVLGTQGLGNRALLAQGHFDLLHVDIRAQSLPYLMEGMDIAERSGIRWRTVLVWVAIGTLTALALGWWSTLTKLYSLGASTAKAEQYPMRKVQIAFNEIERVRLSPSGPDHAGIAAMVFAAGFTVLLAWLRRLGLSGLHPVGYVLCNTLTIGAFTVPFFIAWVVKTSVLRFGGNTAYRRSVPFFVGITLGDVTIQAAWALVGWIFNVPIYQFLT